jgi:hypothetical protein
MTVSKELVKGIPRLVGNPAPTLRADYNALADRMLAIVDGFVETPQDLPNGTNTEDPVWPGRRLFVKSNKGTYQHDGTGWVLKDLPWTEFSPTYSGATISPGAGAFRNHCFYSVSNGRVFVEYALVFGGTASTVSFTDFNLDLPHPKASWFTLAVAIGQASFYDASGGAGGRWLGPVLMGGTNMRAGQSQVANGNLLRFAVVSDTSPFEFTANDFLAISASYPAA